MQVRARWWRGYAIASYIIANVRANKGAFARAVSVAAVLAMPVWSSLDLVRQFASNERANPLYCAKVPKRKIGAHARARLMEAGLGQ